MNRSAGVLLPVSSLPSRYGIGCFSREAYDFVDWLAGAGQSFWQVLPLCPTGYGDSPYQSFSTFAGNPYFIDLEALTDEGLLTGAECEGADLGDDPAAVDYGKLYENRLPLLRLAWSRAGGKEDPAYREFVSKNAWWLEDYALFMALKEKFGGAPWTQWPQELRLRDAGALEEARTGLAEELDFQRYLQYRFTEQWQKLKAYANAQGIKIIGDLPIYAAMDSADAWAHPELFQLNGDGTPAAVAGVPPDGFSADGQLWGSPLYRWEYHKRTGYRWWLERLAYCFRLYDVLRLDHFRGFDEYYAVPYGETTARNGHWEKGPGLDFFRTVREALGERELIAEDLGYVTDSVRRLVRESGVPGMRVLQFAFDHRDSGTGSDYLPHNYPEHCVACTGTHDNETAAGWLHSIRPAERAALRAYLCDRYTPDGELYRPFAALALRSSARLCVLPIQDWLGLDNSARINTPSTVGGNWRWRLTPGQLTGSLQAELRAAALRYGRLPADTGKQAERVTLDLTGCTNRAGLYRELRTKMEWESGYGENLDALWDILTGLPYKGDAFLIRRLRVYADEGFTGYVNRVCGVFQAAQDEGALSVRVEFARERA